MGAKIGHTPWNKGLKYPTPWKVGSVPWNKGKKGVQVCSDETRKKMSIMRSGEKHPMFGKKQSEESKEKNRQSQLGDKGHSWSGDAVGIQGVHTWVEKMKGKPMSCEHCLKTDQKKYEWANKFHTYKRVLDDYIRLCSKCHAAYDKKFNPKRYKK